MCTRVKRWTRVLVIFLGMRGRGACVGLCTATVFCVANSAALRYKQHKWHLALGLSRRAQEKYMPRARTATRRIVEQFEKVCLVAPI